MEIVQVYIAEAKRLYIARCMDRGEEPNKEALQRFDQLIRSEFNVRET